MDIIGKISLNADREEMKNFDPQVPWLFNPRGYSRPAGKVGGLHLSYFGYYYF